MALSVTHLSGFGGGGRYVNNPIMITMSNAYLVRGADLTGNADSKVLTASFYFNITGGPSSDMVVCSNAASSAADTFSIRRKNTNKFWVLGQNSAGTALLQMETSQSYTEAINPGLHHFFCVFDLASAGSGHIYIDGVEDTVIITFTNDTIDYTLSDFSIGAFTAGSAAFQGCLGQVYINNAEYDNTPSDYYNNGYVGFGADGSGPTGTQPIVFLNNSLSTWQTNLGSGGGFTEVNTLADCA